MRKRPLTDFRRHMNNNFIYCSHIRNISLYNSAIHYESYIDSKNLCRYVSGERQRHIKGIIYAKRHPLPLGLMDDIASQGSKGHVAGRLKVATNQG